MVIITTIRHVDDKAVVANCQKGLQQLMDNLNKITSFGMKINVKKTEMIQKGVRRIQIVHDLANTGGYVELNRQLRTERDGDTEKGCQELSVQQKTTDD